MWTQLAAGSPCLCSPTSWPVTVEETPAWRSDGSGPSQGPPRGWLYVGEQAAPVTRKPPSPLLHPSCTGGRPSVLGGGVSCPSVPLPTPTRRAPPCPPASFLPCSPPQARRSFLSQHHPSCWTRPRRSVGTTPPRDLRSQGCATKGNSLGWGHPALCLWEVTSRLCACVPGDGDTCPQEGCPERRARQRPLSVTTSSLRASHGQGADGLRGRSGRPC